MKTPLKITFHGLETSEALETRIREHAEKLERLHSDITSCHVVVERPAGHKHKGGAWEIRIHLEVTGAHIDVAGEPGEDHSHEDPYVALGHAFDRAARQLETHARRQQHHAG